MKLGHIHYSCNRAPVAAFCGELSISPKYCNAEIKLMAVDVNEKTIKRNRDIQRYLRDLFGEQAWVTTRDGMPSHEENRAEPRTSEKRISPDAAKWRHRQKKRSALAFVASGSLYNIFLSSVSQNSLRLWLKHFCTDVPRWACNITKSDRSALAVRRLRYSEGTNSSRLDVNCQSLDAITFLDIRGCVTSVSHSQVGQLQGKLYLGFRAFGVQFFRISGIVFSKFITKISIISSSC